MCVWISLCVCVCGCEEIAVCVRTVEMAVCV